MMERSFSRQRSWILTSLLAMLVVSTSGCLHTLLATGIYVWQGGNIVDAKCKHLEEQRVVVVCRPPSSNEYRHAGAARSIGKQVSRKLRDNEVPGIDVVSPSEVDNWIDEQDWDNFKDLGRAVKATRIVYIELDNFDLYKGSTLYQGNANVNIQVFDMENGGKELWNKELGQILFPRNSGIPSADKSVQVFQKQFIEVVSSQIAEYFYKHDPNASFALDAIANK
jgi:hypothetical protein